MQYLYIEKEYLRIIFYVYIVKYVFEWLNYDVIKLFKRINNFYCYIKGFCFVCYYLKNLFNGVISIVGDFVYMSGRKLFVQFM